MRTRPRRRGARGRPVARGCAGARGRARACGCAGARARRRPRPRPRPSWRAWTPRGCASRPSRCPAWSRSAWSPASPSTSSTRPASTPRTGAPRAIWPTRSAMRPSCSPRSRSTALAIVAVVIASTVGYALAFWDFRLTRHPGGTLHVTRGLITTRATTIEERRLHGAEISEPLLLRMAKGARLIAIATGLRVGRGAERGGSLLVPPAPREAVARVAEQVIGDATPMTCALVEHGPRARRRRYTRALAGWALARRGAGGGPLGGRRAGMAARARARAAADRGGARRRPLPQPRARRLPARGSSCAAARSSGGAASCRARASSAGTSSARSSSAARAS